MFRKLTVAGVLIFLSSCGSSQQVVKVNPTDLPLQNLKEEIVVPKLKVSSSPSYVPAKWIRVYRCSYADENGNVKEGEFIYVKIRDEKIKASF